MIWQDVVFSLGSIFFCVALIPTLRDRHARVPLFTSLTTAFWLVAFAAAQVTLGCLLAPACEMVCTFLWLLIAARELRCGWCGTKPRDPGGCSGCR